MYANTAAVSRPEITEFLEEAKDAEKFYIAQHLMPVYTAAAKAGRYPRIRTSNGELLKKEATKRGNTGTYNEVSRKFDWDTFDCEDRGLVERIDDTNRLEMQDFFDMEVITAKLVLRANMLAYEADVAGQLLSPVASGFTSTNSAVAYTEANIATLDFARDLTDAKERLTQKAQVPNTLVLSLALFNRIARSTKLQTYLYGSLGGGTERRIVTPEDIAKAFMIPNVMIAQASYDSAAKGKDTTLAPVWSPSYFLLANVAGGDFSNGGIGRTIVWGADCPNGMWVTETYRDEDRRSDMVRVRSNRTEKIIDATAAELVATQWA